ncbi:Starch-binding associating with outer membrane [Pricia antarctica]|uniref:Starch-binding associating with outer membrane n=1 Tax=Pricia antarctica TaxID=641691 RepID=A0A1G7IZJ0_9FLAO|nr:RagB/SusD family nutrient uptake outer membrane protein [Pricia antarctica]SDF18152.1 Starch-binding associating with outer membrane [Pricia antarctica]
MKRFIVYTRYSLVLFMVGCIIGCTDVLEENPVSVVAPSNFYKTDSDFEAAINGSLRALFGGYGNFSNVPPHIISAGAEDTSSRAAAPSLNEFDTFQPTVNNNFARNMWIALYNSINVCNSLIANIDGATEVSDTNKRSYEGQARYIRALSYFYLTRWWGEVPIITFENQLDAANVGQSSVAAIYEVIVDDLTYAESNLPLTFEDRGRPTKGAAQIMLAEVYLNMAGWPLKDSSKYTLARDMAKKVIDSGIYSLEDEFLDLWLVANKTTNTEFIFAFYGSPFNGAGATSPVHQSMRPGEEGGFNTVLSEARFFYSFPEGPRKDATFWTVFADEANTTWEESAQGKPVIAKYRDGGVAASRDQGLVNGSAGEGFFVVNRYAEALLIYAEASNMAEGMPSQDALDALNMVRRRASGYDQSVYPDLLPGMAQQAFDEAVINERKWEFAFEVKRWFDLVRKEMVVSANIDLYPNVKEHNRLLPKPQTEVDLINGLEQNEGY